LLLLGVAAADFAAEKLVPTFLACPALKDAERPFVEEKVRDSQ